MIKSSELDASGFFLTYLVKALFHHSLGGAQLVVNPWTVHGIHDVKVEEQRFQNDLLKNLS